jgi:hypothetical protein
MPVFAMVYLNKDLKFIEEYKIVSPTTEPEHKLQTNANSNNKHFRVQIEQIIRIHANNRAIEYRARGED